MGIISRSSSILRSRKILYQYHEPHSRQRQSVLFKGKIKHEMNEGNINIKLMAFLEFYESACRKWTAVV